MFPIQSLGVECEVCFFSNSGKRYCFCINFPSAPSFFMKTQCIVGSSEGKHFKTVSNLSPSQTHLLFFSVKTMRNNSETDTNKSAQL